MSDEKNKASKLLSGFSLEEFMEKHKSLELYFLIVIFLAIMIIIYTIFVHPISSSNNNLSSCSNIILSSYKDSCILNLAENQSAPSLCQQLPSSLANQCYIFIAQNTLNGTLCSKSSGEYMQSCIDYVSTKTNNISLCSKLNGNNDTFCTTNLAITDNKSSLCNYLTNSSEKLVCYSSLNLSTAYAQKNISYCNSMSTVKNNTLSNEIMSYSGVSSLTSGSNSSIFYVSPLDYIQSLQNVSYSPKDMCYIAVSLGSKNSSYCDNLKNETLYSLCSSSAYYSTNKNNSTNSSNLNISQLNTSKQFSKKFNYTSIFDTCLNYSTYSGSNPSTCNYTVSIIHAVSSENVSYCPSGNTTYAYQCYYLLAKTLNQTKYCSYILNATQNSACYQTLTNNISG